MPTPSVKKFREERNTLERKIVRLATSGKLANAGRKAVRAQKRLGLRTTFKEGNRIVRQHPDGQVEVLGQVQPPPTPCLEVSKSFKVSDKAARSQGYRTYLYYVCTDGARINRVAVRVKQGGHPVPEEKSSRDMNALLPS